MRCRQIHESNGQRTFAVILQTGDEVAASLQRFAAEQNILAAQLTAIGALSDVVLQYFDWQIKQYAKTPVTEQTGEQIGIDRFVRLSSARSARPGSFFGLRRVARAEREGWPGASVTP